MGGIPRHPGRPSIHDSNLQSQVEVFDMRFKHATILEWIYLSNLFKSTIQTIGELNKVHHEDDNQGTCRHRDPVYEIPKSKIVRPNPVPVWCICNVRVLERSFRDVMWRVSPSVLKQFLFNFQSEHLGSTAGPTRNKIHQDLHTALLYVTTRLPPSHTGRRFSEFGRPQCLPSPESKRGTPTRRCQRSMQLRWQC